MRQRTTAALILLLAGCGRWEAQDGWDAPATRAVARAEAAAGEGPLIVLQYVAASRDAELPWGVRQSLTTGGIQLTDNPTPPDATSRVLIFDAARRDGSDWVVDTRTVLPGGSVQPTTWRVRCDNDLCTASHLQ
jgi:hypothetical protein